MAIVVEPDLSAKYSVIWLHGLGADGNDFVNLVPELTFQKKKQTRFIFPHAPIRPVSINNGMRMRAWFDIYSLADLSREDSEGIKTSQATVTEYILEQIANAIAPNNIVLAGFSQGGAIALYTGLRFPKKLAGVIGLSTYLPLAQTLNLEKETVNQTTSIFLAHGHHDAVLPVQAGHRTYEFLQKLNYPISWHTYPMGHEVCQLEIKALNAWFDQVLL